MTTSEEIIKSWDWRIRRVGMNQSTFSVHVGIDQTSMNLYIKGRRKPSLARFEKIENELSAMERAAGVE